MTPREDTEENEKWKGDSSWQMSYPELSTASGGTDSIYGSGRLIERAP